MIFGDPYKFAIQFDYVKEWEIANLVDDGVFTFIIKGYYHPLELFAISEKISIYFGLLLEEVHKLFHKVDNDDLFLCDCDVAYGILNDIGAEIREKFDDPSLSEYIDKLYALRDNCLLGMPELDWPNHDYAWLISSGAEEKIIFKKPGGEIDEIILEKGYCLRVMLDAMHWAKERYRNSDTFSAVGTKYRYDLIPKG